MFRDLARIKQKLSPEECIEILKHEPRGVLSLLGDEGYPYGMPMNHWYCPEDGKLYFHGGKKGHKIDALKANSKASFCVMDKGFKKEGEWALNIKSVIAFGKVQLVTDIKKAKEICTGLVQKFTDDQEYLEKELTNSLANVQCFEFTIEHMTGKLVNES